MKNNKIITLAVLLTLGVPFTSFASVDKNLKYGQRDTEVTELQEFLIDKGLLKTIPSTFFGLLTLKAVKAYQTSTGLPSTGFVGILTREKINKEIDAEVATSNEAERTETGTVKVIAQTSSTTKVTTTPVTPTNTTPYTQPNTQVQPAVTNNNGLQTYTPVVISKRDITITNNTTSSVYASNITTKDTIKLSVVVMNESGANTTSYYVYVTDPDGTRTKVESSGYTYYFTYTPTTAGVKSFTFDVPELGIKKSVNVSIDPFVAIPPVVSFVPKSINTIKLSDTNGPLVVSLGTIFVDPKNQNVVFKDLKYSLISSDYSITDIPVFVRGIGSGDQKQMYNGAIGYQGITTPREIPIEINPKLITKTGTFKLKIDGLTLITDISSGNLNDNNVQVNVDGFVSNDVTVTQ